MTRSKLLLNSFRVGEGCVTKGREGMGGVADMGHGVMGCGQMREYGEGR